MLVLARKLGQKIVLGREGEPPMVITLMSLDRNVVRLGFDGPTEVRVLRAELDAGKPPRSGGRPARGRSAEATGTERGDMMESENG
jgi:carbon storage regulator CsrA